MIRDYEGGVHDNATYFIGTEVEKTPAQGQRTLFVVGLQPVNEIIKIAKIQDVEHIYLGANQSFEANSKWKDMILGVLREPFTVTVDFDVSQVEWFISENFQSYNNCIPQISVKLPNIEKLGYNATVKLDDTDFSDTNCGVWCHSLHKLMDREQFTSWAEYGKDEIIE